MGSPHGFDAGLEFDELQNVIDRGSGAIPTGTRFTNAATNLGTQTLLATAGITLTNGTSAQDIFTAGHNVTLQPNTVYIFEGQFVLNGGTGLTNIQLSFVASTALSYIGYQAYTVAATADAAALTGGSTVNGIAATATSLLAATSANPVRLVEVAGSFKTGSTLTTLRPQITYTVTPGSAPVTEAGSYMTFYPAVSQ